MQTELENLAIIIAVAMAKERAESIGDILPIARVLIAALQREYHMLGAPDGETTAGFLIWLSWQLRMTQVA